jgi:hypothetical protein
MIAKKGHFLKLDNPDNQSKLEKYKKEEEEHI